MLDLSHVGRNGNRVCYVYGVLRGLPFRAINCRDYVAVSTRLISVVIYPVKTFGRSGA